MSSIIDPPHFSYIKRLPPYIYDTETYTDIAYNKQHKRKVEYKLWISYGLEDTWMVSYWKMMGGDFYSLKIQTVDEDPEVAAEAMLLLLAEKGYEQAKGFAKV